MDVVLFFALVLIAAAILLGSAGVIANTQETAASFVIRAARGGMAEVALSQIATESARDYDVRRLAALMVADHSRAAHELRRLAAAKKWRVPANLDPLHRAMARRLQKLSGAAFDRAYLQAIVTEHDQTVEMFRDYARTGSDPDLKDWVVRLLPALEGQQRMAQATADGWAPGASHRATVAQAAPRGNGSGPRTAPVPREA